MSIAYLSLGSNLGDSLAYLARAAHALGEGENRLLGVSSVYETAPQGKTDQSHFLNIAVAVKTEWEPLRLLAHIQEVERSLGRVRHERWGPRTIDIDIALCGDAVVDTTDLVLPHPRMAERAFVLIPLLELNPTLVLPTSGEGLRGCLDRLSDQGVTPILDANSFLQRVRAVQ